MPTSGCGKPYEGIDRVDIEFIRDRIRAGNYLIKSHAVQHDLKEGFERKHIVEAILRGTAIEEYPNNQRVLICGKTTLSENVTGVRQIYG